MALEAITGTSSMAAAEFITQTIELLTEAAIEAKNVFVGKESFSELASYLDRIVPLLKELNKKDISNAETSFIEILNRQVRLAKELMTECRKKNRVYLLVNCRSITKRVEDITREISRALSLVPFSQLDISASMVQELGQLCESMQSIEFKTSIADEMILEKIESGIHGRNVDRAYANELLVSIAQALEIPTERSALKKEFEEFKSEIENAQLRKNHAEAIQLDQIIILLERADVANSPEEKERKYFRKRSSLGSHPLEPLQSFSCPITREVMVDPVETSSGHTFERSAIEKWLADGNGLCPLTMTRLDNLILRPNRTLRQSIEEWKDRNTMITIASMKSKLSRPFSENEEEVLCCMEQLQNICEQRDIHREWILLENYIPILVELLGGKNREIRTRALVMLCMLAKDSDDAKDRIAKVDGVIKSTVHSLGRRIAEGKLAVELLLELSRHEALQKRIGMVHGCILLLVTMSNSDDAQAATLAKKLLDNLSFSDHNVIQMAKANYFTHLLQRLSSGSEDVKMSMVTTLAEMELTDHSKSSLFEGGVLDSLLHLVSHGNTKMKETAAKALRNLSSLPKNSIQMIRQGSVNPLVNLLYNHTSSNSLKDEVAAIIMHLAISTMSQDSSETPVSLFESDGDIDSLFSFIGCTRPSVQESLLCAFYGMCRSPLATTVKAKLRQNSENEQALVDLCKNDNQKVRAKAVKLFCCLTEDDGDDKETIEHLGLQLIETLVKIIRSSSDVEEIASAMGIISNLAQSSELTELLLRADGLPSISACLRDGMYNGSHKKQLIDNATGSLCHFTIPTNQHSQKKVAEAGVIPLLVQLLEQGTSVTKRKASISLAQLSKSSAELSRPIPKPLGILRCFSPQTESRCMVHQGICSVETSFCLVEAEAVSPLVTLLADPDLNVSEASLDALLTLIEAERLPHGCKVLAEADAIPPIIKLLCSSCSSLQEKVLNSLERIFRLVDLKQRYGQLAQMTLVDLTQRGNNTTKSLAARILAQLNVLHDQSSYF